jgi:leucyl-tRNA synthetase
MTPKKIYYYAAAPWKWKAYLTAAKNSVSTKVVQSELMTELMKDNDMKKNAKHLAKFIGQLVDEVNRLSAERKQRHLRVGIIDEKQSLKEATLFFKREFNSEIIVYDEEDPKRHDPKNRAQLAKPYRPAIYVE